MHTNQLGHTNIQVSHLSFGGAALSNFYREFDEAKGTELLELCFANGINYIDTGPWYGHGQSEVTCGKALAGIPRDRIFVGSKVGRYEADVAKMFDFSAEKSHASVQMSLDRLRLDYVDIIQVHDLSFAPDIAVVLRETLPALAKEVTRGHARYIGLCDYDLDLMKEVVEESEVKISTVLSYAKSTMLDNRLQKYIDFFKSNGIGVINASSNAMGLLTNEGERSWHPAPQDVRDLCRRAARYCQANGVELARLAQKFAFGQPGVDTHVIGVQETWQLEQALHIHEHGLSEHEQKIFADVNEKIFKGETHHWDGVEVPKYREKLAASFSDANLDV